MDVQYSLTGKRWREADTQSGEDVIAQLRTLRGITDDGEMMDVSAFQDFPIAQKLVMEAIAKKEVVGIFGDYDCDGITSAAQIARFFKRHGLESIIKLPHRAHEGYGIRPSQVDAFAEQGVTLLITVDTGVSGNEAIDRAREKQMKTIVLDHHRIPKIPAAPDALLHPGIDMPDTLGAPSAAGLCYGFVAALEGGVWVGQEEDVMLAALGTIADLVPLMAGNRTLVQCGLAALPKLTGTLAEFVKSAGIEQGATARDLAFRLAPRVNAAGRMDDPKIALDGLLGDTEALTRLTQLNEDRQLLVRTLFETVQERIDPSAAMLCIADASYTPGVVGLIAGKLAELFGKPSIVACIQGDMCTASLRSIPAYDVTAGLTRNADLLTSFGGHAQAAGCSFPLKNADELFRRLSEDVAAHVPEEELRPFLTIDATVEPRAVTTQFFRALTALEPFGQGNPEPRFMLSGVRLSEFRVCGAEDAHLQIQVGHLKGIAFRLGSIGKDLRPDEAYDIACRISVQTWRGQTSLQLMVDDIRVAVPATVNS